LVAEKVQHGAEYEEVLDWDYVTIAYHHYIIHDFDYTFTHYEASEKS
jgi:hypothetical protein